MAGMVSSDFNAFGAIIYVCSLLAWLLIAAPPYSQTFYYLTRARLGY